MPFKLIDALLFFQLMEAASAVTYLHQHGVIHGDIKASNILVTDDIHALLCDFTPTLQAEEATSAGPRGAGTVRWQSPELWTENAQKSFQSDVWAFGITTYEVCQTIFRVEKILTEAWA